MTIKKFFVLFEQGAQNTVKIAQQLRDLVNIVDRPTNKAKELADIIVQAVVEYEQSLC